MQIAPRTLLCGTTFRVGGGPEETGFDQLRELATASHDDVSLAIGMAGQLTVLAFSSHYREAARMASELETLVESIADPNLTVALLYTAAQAKYEAGQASECIRLAQRVVDLADGDPVLLRIVDGELHVRPVHNALSRVQARLRAHIPAGTNLSDELIADRRQASEHE